MKRLHCLSVACSLLLVPASLAAQDAQARLEAEFLAQMNGCRMEGEFTVTGSKKPPAKDSYTIAKASKLDDERWRLEAKIEYGEKSATLPIVVKVRWAGDTPVIQVTDLFVPTMGTYTARVTVFRGHYAGLWMGKGYGGYMWGRILPPAAEGTGEQAESRQPVGPAKGEVLELADVTEAEAAAPGAADADWRTWRGPLGSGEAKGKPPVEWSEDKNLVWKTAVPGLGISTPILLGDRLYVTTAIPKEGAPGEAQPEEPARQGGGRQRRQAPSTPHAFAVAALDATKGSIVWRRTVTEVVPHEAGHATGSLASNSPITDGERIYAHFGSRGIHCLDLDGKVLWSKDLGRMRTRNEFGEGSSPALWGDTLIVNWDHEAGSFVVALDKKTGEEKWRQDRDEITSWSTPIVVPVDGKPQVIINATKASRGYDLATGALIWSLGGMTANTIPTPIHENGVVWLMSGFRGAMLQAVKLEGAKGDLAGTEQVLWSHGQNTSYVPSALLYQGCLYFLRGNNGVLSCLDAATGKPHYEARKIEDLKTVYSSPVAADGRVYLTSREGVTKVIAAGPEYKELATNVLDDSFDASMAIVGDRIYLRGRKSLYCIGAKAKARL